MNVPAALRRAAWLMAATSLAVGVALAGEETLELRAAPGRELVYGRCALCHSLDYITMNAPVMTPALWEKSVVKMVKVMGAPVTEDDSRAILAYLDANYALAPKPAP
jgi:hypothetical protein